MNRSVVDVVVIGGGIAGLSAAHAAAEKPCCSRSNRCWAEAPR
ncbi:FAD-binding protein [Nocardia rhamnosiphila]